MEIKRIISTFAILALGMLAACQNQQPQASPPTIAPRTSTLKDWYSDASYAPIGTDPSGTLQALATSDRFNSPTNFFSSDWSRSNLEVISKPVTEAGATKTVWQLVANPTTTGTLSAPITASNWAFNQRMTVSALFFTSKVGGATVQLALRDIVNNADFVDLTTPKAPNPVNCVIPANIATRCSVTLVNDDGSAGAFQIRGIPNDVAVFAGDVIATNNTTGVTGSTLIANPTDFSPATWTRTNIQLYAQQLVAAGPILYQLRGNTSTAGNTSTLFKTAVGEAAQITASVKLIADRPVSTVTLSIRQKLAPANVYATVTVPSFSTTQVTASITVSKPNDGLAAEFVIGGMPQNTTVWVGDAQEVSSTPLGGPVIRTYTASTAELKNPERGFKYTKVVYFNPVSQTFENGSSNNPVATAQVVYNGTESLGANITTLQGSSGETVAGPNRTVIVYSYVLTNGTGGNGLTTAIPPTALNKLTSDFAEARANGFKVIPAFSYCFVTTGTPPTCTEPPLAQILSHIDQLATVLTANSDVIALIRAGLVGQFGEWNRSFRFANIENLSYSGGPQPTAQAIADAKAVTDRWLLKLPSSMFVSNRYQSFKRSAASYNFNTALTSGEGFTGTAKARLAHFNDCFNVDDANFGTYTDIAPQVLPGQLASLNAQKQYLSDENQYMPQSGEECPTGMNPILPPISPPKNGLLDPNPCESAKADFSKMRWSIFEGSNDGLQTVGLNGGSAAGSYAAYTSCMAEVRNKLGYRLRVTETTIPSSVQRGTAFNMSFKMVNDGWASPYNQRKLEIILKNGTTIQRFPVTATSSGTTSSDPRRWLPGQTYSVSVSGTVPSALATGSYDVLMNLPDPNTTLANTTNNSKYAIRLASLRGGTEVWDAATGFNLLAPAAVSVTP
jgi:archaellum component FlaF (FlaF/FlaG flagellin family)